MKRYICPECNEILEPGVLCANAYCHACAVRKDTSDLIVLGDDEGVLGDDEGEEQSVDPVQETKGSFGQPVRPEVRAWTQNTVSERVPAKKTRFFFPGEAELETIDLASMAHWELVSLQYLPPVSSDVKLLVIDGNTKRVTFWLVMFFFWIIVIGVFVPIGSLFIIIFGLSFLSVCLVVSFVYFALAYVYYIKNCTKTCVYISKDSIYVKDGVINKGRFKQIRLHANTRVECQSKNVKLLNSKKYIIHLEDGQEDVPVVGVWHPFEANNIMTMMQQIIEVMNKCNGRASKTKSSANNRGSGFAPRPKRSRKGSRR